jgi:hypothetical protein
MVGMNQLMDYFKCVNPNDYCFCPSDIENLYTCYSKNGDVHTGIRIKRRNHIQTKTYYFVSKEPMYKLNSDENIFGDDMELMSLEELSEILREIK